VERVDYDPGVYGLGVALFLLLFLAGYLFALAREVFSIKYALSERELRITHGGVRHIVPLALITGVLAPGNVIGGKSVTVRRRGPSLPGYEVTEGRSAQLGRVVSVATVPPTAQLFIRTPGAAYGISPQDTVGFLAALDERRKGLDELEQDMAQAPTTERRGASGLAYALWGDRPARYLLLGGLVLNVLFFGYIALVYGDLPALLPMHWNAQAQVDRIGAPSELLRLPTFALSIWLANVVLGWWVLPRERAATLFLLTGTVAVQVVFWVGAFSIVIRTL
jgi:hypothetical protein